MRFGIFDHLDANGQVLRDQYEQRLRLIEGYERAGMYAYHLAEHHATPLGMAPSPAVFLAAAAQRTSTIRLGALVFTLALYHPLRLAEEICMLDHLSNGRLDVGIGRGISPIEIDMYGVDNATAQARYLEASKVILQALTSPMLDHEGTHFRFRKVPLPMSPLQKPHPPLWYGVPNPQSVEWLAHNGINAVTLGPPALVRGITDRYREIWAGDGRDPAAIPHMGFTRHVVVADTDAQALDIAVRAYKRWHHSFWYLWLDHNSLGVNPPHAVFPADFNALIERGTAIVGSPDTVREKFLAQASASGANYALLDVSFGDMAPEDSARSIDLFARHVMPAFAE